MFFSNEYNQKVKIQRTRKRIKLNVSSNKKQLGSKTRGQHPILGNLISLINRTPIQEEKIQKD